MRFSRARISGSFVPIDLAFSILVLLIKTTNISEGEVCIFYRSGVTEVGNMAKTSNSNQEWNPTLLLLLPYYPTMINLEPLAFENGKELRVE